MRKALHRRNKVRPSYMLSFCSKALILAAGVNPYAAASDIAETQDTSDIMDKSTKAELEAVRKQTPRYLFRLWSYGKAGEPPTGGHAGLNTETPITPIAFGNGKGHKSVYDMTREFFAEMVSRHLCVFHIETEFSSWSASLNYILSKCPGISSAGIRYSERDEDHVYVSVIDTEMLWETNQVFYVPLLRKRAAHAPALDETMIYDSSD